MNAAAATGADIASAALATAHPDRLRLADENQTLEDAGVMGRASSRWSRLKSDACVAYLSETRTFFNADADLPIERRVVLYISR